ncbi:hypothetical protein [Microcoleus sp. T2B6]|uniref:hypothetical protein n=1 Tax=Microcoleus sp. T2B6 TaxID=3055424 RepID=UPI002FCFA3BE
MTIKETVRGLRLEAIDFGDDLAFICNSLYNWLPKIYNSKTGKRLQGHYNLIEMAIER